MSILRTTSPTDLDPHRLAVAFHELGHYIAWKPLRGARIRHVRVTGHGTGTRGEVYVDWPKDPGLDRGYLVGLLAGGEADRLRAERTSGRLDKSGWTHDMSVFRRVRRTHAPSRQWSESSLRADARRLLRAHWSDIERLAPELARRGRISV